MKNRKYFFIFIIMFASVISNAQTERFYYKILDTVDCLPNFPGGTDSLENFIFYNYQWPEWNICVNGYVYAEFCICKDGRVSEIKIIRGLDSLLDKELMRVLSLMPKWIPAKKKGKPISTKVLIGVYLGIED